MGGYSGTAADLSVVCAARGGFANTRKVIECLLGQSIAPRIELIVVSDSAELLRDIEGFVAASGCFARCEFLPPAAVDLVSDRIRGATKATAELVVFTEDHAFPDRLWAEEIVAAFGSSENVLAAAPLLRNPNPESAVSRAQFLLTHGSRERGSSAGRFEDCDHLPWHATAYRNDVFLTVTGGGNVDLLQAEGFLQEKIREAHPAARLVRCTRTRTDHVNMSRMWPALLHAFHGGRIFAAVRTKRRGWGLGSRMARAVSFPLVAVLKMLRSAAVLWDGSSPLRTVAHTPVAIALAFVHAMGEAVGTCVGMGSSAETYATLEYDRAGFLRPADRHLLFSTGDERHATSHERGSVTDRALPRAPLGEHRP